MKTTNSENKVACLGVLGGATAVLLVMGLLVVFSGLWIYHAFTSAASDFNRSPFAGAQNTRPYVRPANVYFDLQTIPVRDNSDTSDEKVILHTIEAKLRVSQAPVFQATWLRLVTGQNPQRCTFTYFRDDMHLQYEVLA